MVIRVLVADDQPLVRTGLRTLLDLAEDIEVVAEAGDGAEAVDRTRQARPEVVLMDIRMPLVDGIEATRRITADPDLGEVRVVALTTYEFDEYVFAALRAGASGFLTKDVTPDQLRDAVRATASGESLLSPSATKALIAEFVDTPPRRHDPARLDALTERERDVVRLVATGLTNEQIGERLHMSPATARTHISRAIGKLGLRDRTQLVVVAYETGLAEL